MWDKYNTFHIFFFIIYIQMDCFLTFSYEIIILYFMFHIFFIAYVARVQRRGDCPPSRKMVCGLSLANVERQGILVFYQWKI
jgi:hypothetical protein